MFNCSIVIISFSHKLPVVSQELSLYGFVYAWQYVVILQVGILRLRPYIVNPSLVWKVLRIREPPWPGETAFVSISPEANLYIRPTHLGRLAGKFSLHGRGTML